MKSKITSIPLFQNAVQNKRLCKSVITLITVLVLSGIFIACGGNSNPTGSGSQPNAEFDWTTAPPEENGFNPDLLDTLTKKLGAGQFGRITSLLIVRNGYLVYEEYFRGIKRDSLVQIYSCTKSIVSALIGIAIYDGKIPDVNVSLLDYLDGYECFPKNCHDSLFREALTLEHLLTMTAGFEWDEMNVPYGNALNSYNQMVGSDDWIQFTLNRPIVAKPGTVFNYNTGLSGLMAIVLQNVSGWRVDYYAQAKLFKYIGIDTFEWRKSPTGIPITGSGLKLRPRDMAKFGWLYSQNGVWDGDTIVPESWINASIHPHCVLSGDKAYGYQWWMVRVTDDQNNPIDMPYALGYGGQHIFVPKGFDLVIVVTADDDQDVAETYIGGIINLIGQAFTP